MFSIIKGMKRKWLLLLAPVFLFLSFLIPFEEPFSAPDQFGLKEGDVIRSDTDNDIYIINEHNYKRLFLNPVIFGFYGHLGGFENVKLISREARDSFKTSSLFRNCENNDKKVYALELNGEDEGTLHWVNINGVAAVAEDQDFFKKVFCINSKEFSWYDTDSPYTSLSQVLDYSFVAPVRPLNLTVDLKINGSDNSGPIEWNSILNVAWTSKNAVKCSGMPYIALIDEKVDRDNLPTQGNLSFYGRHTVPSDLKNITAQILCYDKNNNYADDYIVIPIKEESAPSIQNIAISTAKVKLGENYQITWKSKNLNSGINIILGKGASGEIGEFWYIVKNIPNTGNYAWNTGTAVTPDIIRGTVDGKLQTGKYVIIILNSEETIFSSSGNEFEIVR